MTEDGSNLPDDHPGDDDSVSTPEASQPAMHDGCEARPVSQAARRPAEFSTARVLRVVIPAALIGMAVYGFVVIDGAAKIQAFFQPPLVPAKGSIFYKGKPLVGAMVLTEHARDGLQGALAETDEYGQFELQTDIRGVYQRGAFAGVHRITVGVYEPSSGPGPATLKSPEKFASLSTSPLTIEVRASTDLNEFPINLDDFMEEGEAGGQHNELVGMTRMILSRYDKDEDSALSLKEIESVDEQYRASMRQADTNGDGRVDVVELRRMVANRGGASRPEAAASAGNSSDGASSEGTPSAGASSAGAPSED